MKVLRIYVDTSVLGGCFDPEVTSYGRDDTDPSSGAGSPHPR